MTTWLIERDDPPYSGTLVVEEDGTATITVDGETVDTTSTPVGRGSVRLVDILDQVLKNWADTGFTVTEVEA